MLESIGPTIMMNRRTFLAYLSGMYGLPSRSWAEEEKIALWSSIPRGEGGPTGAVKTGKRGSISNIAMPYMTVFRPAQPNGCAMLLAAGGGYKRIELQGESIPAAKWLIERGITAFVLSYRLPQEGWLDGPLAPLQDAQRAIRLIRKNARDYHINPAKVGLLGFSAGGHLMGLAAARSQFFSYQKLDEVDEFSARPDLAALIYPVITLRPPYNRSSTRKSLIGDRPTTEQSAMWSVETHVKADCPPLFLVHAQDDPVSNAENSRMMAAACEKAGTPVELHLLSTGGHGFGMGYSGQETALWPTWLESWLQQNKF